MQSRAKILRTNCSRTCAINSMRRNKHKKGKYSLGSKVSLRIFCTEILIDLESFMSENFKIFHKEWFFCSKHFYICQWMFRAHRLHVPHCSLLSVVFAPCVIINEQISLNVVASSISFNCRLSLAHIFKMFLCILFAFIHDS